MQTGNRFLYALVFVVGMASLGAEISAARLMAPYFGASTIVWANTIGVVLVALSIGYWLGGRLGDRYPRPRELCLVVGGAALLLAVVPFAARPFFDISVEIGLASSSASWPPLSSSVPSNPCGQPPAGSGVGAPWSVVT